MWLCPRVVAALFWVGGHTRCGGGCASDGAIWSQGTGEGEGDCCGACKHLQGDLTGDSLAVLGVVVL